jgi:ABC-type Fe3+/spermidine/putrescine transport system ATPase subunit
MAVISEGRILQLDTPQRIYRQPADRFVASFIGERSVLRARFDRIDGTMATVMIGPTRITVPSEPLAGLNASVLVDVFVRPEQLRMTTDHAAFEGSVAAAIFQGDHVDLYVDAPHAASTRVLVRLPAIETVPSVGERVAIAIDGVDAIAFPCSA